jgi:hypothetical protein
MFERGTSVSWRWLGAIADSIRANDGGGRFLRLASLSTVRIEVAGTASVSHGVFATALGGRRMKGVGWEGSGLGG